MHPLSNIPNTTTESCIPYGLPFSCSGRRWYPGGCMSNSQAVAGGLSIFCFGISDFQSGARIAGTSTPPRNV